ncbi:MAG: FAD-dependent oxidoreductase [Patescibacteria group bacterium]
MIYDLTIIGGGPAGVGAGVYASRKRLKTLFLTESFNGQSVVSDGIENWIGTIKISGADLCKNLEAHLRAYAADVVDIKTGIWVKSVSKIQDPDTNAEAFKITVAKGNGEESYFSKTVLITTGSVRRKLEAKGAEEFDNKGLTYCATCDGPLFDGKDVFVVGGGNAAFESAAQLAAYCKSVTILNRSDRFRADPVTVEKVLAKPNISSVQNAQIVEVKGDKFVNAIVYKKTDTNETVERLADGIFVEIGLIPNTNFVKDIVELDSFGKIYVDPRTQKTRTHGIWAAGDCTDGIYHQNNIATGDAVKALEDIYAELHTK